MWELGGGLGKWMRLWGLMAVGAAQPAAVDCVGEAAEHGCRDDVVEEADFPNRFCSGIVQSVPGGGEGVKGESLGCGGSSWGDVEVKMVAKVGVVELCVGGPGIFEIFKEGVKSNIVHEVEPLEFY